LQSSSSSATAPPEGDRSQIHLEIATAREPFRTPPGFVSCYVQEMEAKAEVVVRSVADGKAALSAG
jgi:hypothetical protein